MHVVGERLDSTREAGGVGHEPASAVARDLPAVVDHDVLVSRVAQPARDHRVRRFPDQLGAHVAMKVIPAVPSHRGRAGEAIIECGRGAGNVAGAERECTAEQRHESRRHDRVESAGRQGCLQAGGVETCRARATLTNLTSLRRVSNSPRHHDTFRVQPGRRVRDSVRRRADSAEGAKRSDDHPQRNRCAGHAGRRDAARRAGCRRNPVAGRKLSAAYPWATQHPGESDGRQSPRRDRRYLYSERIHGQHAGGSLARRRRADRGAQGCLGDQHVRIARRQWRDRDYHQTRTRGEITMTAGIARCMALSVVALLFAAPASAQRPGAVEIGALARFTDFDNNLGISNAVGAGGRLAVYVRPRLAFELDMSRTSSNRSAGSATYTPLHARLVVGVGRPGRVEGLLGAGYVHNAYRGSLDATDGGFSALIGMRYQLNSRVWVRIGTDLDVMFHPSSDSPFTFYHGNWGLHLGAGARLNGGP